ncbi:MAG: maleylpyruvate isomerase family mycothiol-dependent enzyme [Nocardiopsaceae bacterium]|nr:maleylpyruvate isomerase family mycothiol-dependent enzyme [Nocardiopsaceae bacterium]
MSPDDEIIALLAEPAVIDPPSALRARTLARATSGRRPGRPVDAARPCDPLAAFDRTVADLDGLLRSLTGPEWDAPAHAEHGRVRDLVAHLAGVERLVLRWLDPHDTVPDLPDHVVATRSVVAELAGTDPRDVARQWHEGARAVADAIATVGDRGRMVAFHDLTISVNQLLVTRTGELWAHAIDICQATGRPLPQLDMERMAMLCDELVAAVPLALAYRGSSVPGRAARVVLTGPAGGAFTVPLALEHKVADPEVIIVADAVGFCQVAVRRLRPDQLDAAIEGDLALGDLVLTSIDALARD